MLKICGDKLSCFDIDDTLVYQSCPYVVFQKADFVLIWQGQKIPMWLHKPHANKIKDLHSKKYVIVAWSQQGPDWVDAVIEAAGLKNYVHFGMMKPEEMVDDLPLVYWSKITFIPVE